MAGAAPIGPGPWRTCLGCGGRYPKAELLRFVARDGVLAADSAGRLPGRGAYCCRRKKCLKGFAAKKGRLTRAFRQELVDWSAVAAVTADDSAAVHAGNSSRAD